MVVMSKQKKLLEKSSEKKLKKQSILFEEGNSWKIVNIKKKHFYKL